MEGRARIVLGEEDFAEQEAQAPPVPTGDARVHPPVPGPAAPALPAVSRAARIPLAASAPGAGATTGLIPAGGAASLLAKPMQAMLVTAAVGVFLAWAVTEMLGLGEFHATSKTGLDVDAGLWTGAVGVVFGGTLLAFESAVAGAWNAAFTQFRRAAIPMFAASFVAGFAAQAIYAEIEKSVFEAALRGGGSLSPGDLRLYLARAVGWALFGGGIGVTVGALSKSGQRALNGALGGVAGGAAGGLVFQFVAVNLETSNSTSRLLGLAAVGGLIALATRVVEAVRREAWLQVAAGGMTGKEFIIYHALTRIGSSPDCEIFLLKDPAVAKLHAQIDDRGAQRVLSALPGNAVHVNGSPVGTVALHSGDQIQIGSTVLHYTERALAALPAGT